MHYYSFPSPGWSLARLEGTRRDDALHFTPVNSTIKHTFVHACSSLVLIIKYGYTKQRKGAICVMPGAGSLMLGAVVCPPFLVFECFASTLGG